MLPARHEGRAEEGSRVKKRLFKFGLGLVMAGALTSVGIVAKDSVLEEGALAEARAMLTPTTLPTLLKYVPTLLVASSGRLELYDRPGGERVTLSLEEGALVRVRVVQSAEVDGVPWFKIELVEGKGRGWLPSEQLSLNVTPERSFSHFQFCQGTVARPMGPCGSSLAWPLDGLWLTWHYHGLEPNDMIQRVLIVNGERFQGAPTLWVGPSTGEQLVNLFDEHRPRLEPGLWTVQFYVNGALVNEASLNLLAAGG